jgi:hypothetical protein
VGVSREGWLGHDLVLAGFLMSHEIMIEHIHDYFPFR